MTNLQHDQICHFRQMIITDGILSKRSQVMIERWYQLKDLIASIQKTTKIIEIGSPQLKLWLLNFGT